ncbi:MAG: tetratricopeptide repeat protein, partial [Candidatus Marinimicrobia bacterium]|nr:tetratricopeptide repeat protein [Candidatus Neomarinimicrobiota bacterium]
MALKISNLVTVFHITLLSVLIAGTQPQRTTGVAPGGEGMVLLAQAAQDSAKKAPPSKQVRKIRRRPPATRSKRPPRRKKAPAKKGLSAAQIKALSGDITKLSDELIRSNEAKVRRLAALGPAESTPQAARYRFEGEHRRVQLLMARADDHPEDATLWADLADIEARNGKYASAEAYLLKALSLEPLNQELLYDLGRLYIESGNYHQAWNTSQEVIYLNPDNYQAHLAQGRIRDLEDNHAGAAALYEQVAEEFGLQPEVYYHQVTNRSARGDYGAAITLAREGLQQYPDYAELYYARGAAHFSLGMLDRAKIDYYDALSLDADLMMVYLAIADVSLHEGNYASAARVCLRYLDEYPGSFEASMKLGQAYLADLHFGEAVSEWEMLQYLHGSSQELERRLPQAYYLHSLELKRQGRFQEALDAHGKALQITGG